MQGKNIVLTGKRDQDIMKFIEVEGGEIKSAVNKNTDILIVDNLASTTSKMDKAKKLNVKIVTASNFKIQFLKK